MGAAIFVRYSKHSDLSFASVQQTFSANSRSVGQTLNKTFALCSLYWTDPSCSNLLSMPCTYGCSYKPHADTSFFFSEFHQTKEIPSTAQSWLPQLKTSKNTTTFCWRCIKIFPLLPYEMTWQRRGVYCEPWPVSITQLQLNGNAGDVALCFKY